MDESFIEKLERRLVDLLDNVPKDFVRSGDVLIHEPTKYRLRIRHDYASSYVILHGGENTVRLYGTDIYAVVARRLADECERQITKDLGL